MIHYSIIPNSDGYIQACNDIVERSLYSIWLDLDNSVLVIKNSDGKDVSAIGCDMTIDGIRGTYQSLCTTYSMFQFSA